MPKGVPWHGKTVYTGVYKQTVAGPRMVRRLNIDGDGQGDLGGHGGEQRAVLVYQLDSYRFWANELGRDDLTPGNFGENFTVEGLPDDEVCIGDRYRIGDALFEVTQPRVTCYRVGLRMGEPQMAALLVAHHRPGFYLRVVEEGEVEAGQEIVKVSTGPEAMTVEEIDRVLYLPGHTREQVERALRIPALSPGWQGSMKILLDQSDGDGGGSGSAGLNAAATAPPPAWPGFRPLTVTRIQPESRTVFSLHLATMDGSALPAALPGQFITVKVQPEGDVPPLIRSYSLSGEPGTGRYRISVKVEPHGAASNELRAHIHVGDHLEAAAPRGTFCLTGGDNPVVLLSAGVGATPVLAMLHALARDRSTRQVWWLHGARDGTEHPFAKESRDLIAALPNAKSTVYYSRPTDTDRQGVDYLEASRLSAEPVRRLGLPTDADAYLCGPVAFMDSLTAALVDYGLDPSRIHTEIFGAGPAITPGIKGASTAPAPHPPAGPPGTGPEVSFARSGLTVPWNDAQESLLELAEACDVPVQWSCRTGVCHTCELALMSGAVDYSPDPVEPPAEGNILICCSKPAGGVVVDL
ncbi:MOSC domain-containing protein [Streptomyces mirabilis]|jgi:ferredoxin-NADP reductase/MOSC domain-containing protein YiiM|uniref:MOSC and FAD-binding oxidoreductase domain-containing protein n=1 Tax=Streptomyces TaxID=1883 RepID=UPI0029B4D0BB|nr:MOSC and FAD-binding oxidoreductase domain-containing protein [Streptomyces sp. AK02-04a]MDX3759614.1 MOSC and FAD-binding oxidoreductase domain-containing protein [Streptomyces sp. AK02-04a]